MIIQILLLCLGLALLVKGADWLVEGASTYAKKKNVSNLAIGLTIVAFGTSAPELIVNIIASIQGHTDIVFGNVIGSNNFNLLVILGMSGLITPLAVQSSTVWKEIPISLLAAVILLFLLNDTITFGENNRLSRLDGFILLGLFGAFLWYVAKQLKNVDEQESPFLSTMSNTKIWLYILFGLAGLIVGGQFVVENAREIAGSLGVSDKIIGLTIVAAGTSLPELATSITAALKKNNDIAVGNIIGSNIFNIFLILGVSAVINPMGYNPIFNKDLYFLVGGTIFLFLFMFSGNKTKTLGRWEAGILLTAFIVYTGFLIAGEI
ncbi:cation:H+ antiporter [Flavobacteriaceae bacterium MAR_2010_188]|nr:cation:H+ antiporter [Flavobacteriaceae bacterium MAR_2010_188]